MQTTVQRARVTMSLMMHKSNFEVPLPSFGVGFNHVGQLVSEELESTGEYPDVCIVNRWVLFFHRAQAQSQRETSLWHDAPRAMFRFACCSLMRNPP